MKREIKMLIRDKDSGEIWNWDIVAVPPIVDSSFYAKIEEMARHMIESTENL